MFNFSIALEHLYTQFYVEPTAIIIYNKSSDNYCLYDTFMQDGKTKILMFPNLLYYRIYDTFVQDEMILMFPNEVFSISNLRTLHIEVSRLFLMHCITYMFIYMHAYIHTCYWSFIPPNHVRADFVRTLLSGVKTATKASELPQVRATIVGKSIP
jgi:hypothetical protein